MIEKDPFNTAPSPNQVFAVGDDPGKAHGEAVKVLERTKELSEGRIDETGSYTRQSMNAVVNGEPGARLVNQYLISEARDGVAAGSEQSVNPTESIDDAVLAERRAATEEKTRMMNAAADAMIRRGQSRETERQMGIAAADRTSREVAGLPARVHNLK